MQKVIKAFLVLLCFILGVVVGSFTVAREKPEVADTIKQLREESLTYITKVEDKYLDLVQGYLVTPIDLKGLKYSEHLYKGTCTVSQGLDNWLSLGNNQEIYQDDHIIESVTVRSDVDSDYCLVVVSLV